MKRSSTYLEEELKSWLNQADDFKKQTALELNVRQVLESGGRITLEVPTSILEDPKVVDPNLQHLLLKGAAVGEELTTLVVQKGPLRASSIILNEHQAPGLAVNSSEGNLGIFTRGEIKSIKIIPPQQ